MKQLVLAIVFGAALPAFAQTVTVKDGNIQFTDKAGTTIALTSNGRDAGPVLAADGKWVAFVRKVDGSVVVRAENPSGPCRF